MKRNKVSTLVVIALFCLSCSLFNKVENGSNSSNNSNAAPSVSPTPPASASSTAAKTERNLLSFGAGAVLLKFPVPSSNQFSPNNLLDDGEAFWLSRENEAKDQVFVIGLPGETTFESFSFMNGNDYYGEGSNAKDILVEVSNTSADSGFQKVLETSLPEDINSDKTYPSEAKLPARFLRLTIKNSQKNPSHVSLGEVKGFGAQKIDASLTGLTGTYVTLDQDEGTLGWKRRTAEELKDAGSYNDVYLKQNGTRLVGCEEQGEHDHFNGGIDGSVGQLVWQYMPEDKPTNVVMSFAENGKMMFVAALNEEGTVSTFTAFEKKSDVPGKCANIKGFDSNNTTESKLKDDLEKDGRAVIYGINFDFNSDKLRAESKMVLDEIAKLLKENPDWKMTVEGHTDNIGGEAFNKDLSDKRSASVKNYLTTAGIAADRLESTGLGLSKPIASNDTEIGRARNRRVELVKK